MHSVCNIDAKGQLRRRITGWFFLLVTFIAAVIFDDYQVPLYIEMLLFIPAIFGILGVVQARTQFCVAYAAADRSDFSIKPEKQQRLQKSLQVIATTFVISLLLTMFLVAV